MKKALLFVALAAVAVGGFHAVKKDAVKNEVAARCCGSEPPPECPPACSKK